LLSHENRINWPDGSIHWISAHGRFQYDDNGRPIRVVGVVSDITDRKRAEEALQNSQQRMTAIIDSAMDAVITVGADQRILVFNAAAERIFGCPAEEAIGYSLDRFIPTIFREAHRRHVEGFAGSGTTSRSMHSPGILSGLRANGEEFPLEATISRVTVSGEKLCTVILRDLTQRIQAEQALLRSEKLASVGRMAATIAHEINNPLAAVTNLLYVAKTVDNLPESARQFLEMADAELNRVAHITRQSLGFYREFSVPAPTSVTGVLESAIDLLKNKIKAKQAVIEKQWAKNVEITAIAGELRQVFANLLGNSLDAIGEKGMITLRVSACTASKDSHRCVRVTIADSGNGIDRTAQQHVFEPFFTTKGAVGTGLGLWVSKQIVEKHGGTIRLRSSTDEKHRGTVFSIILPVEPVECGQSAGAT
jgi:PAS domain S-box-containing protein